MSQYLITIEETVSQTFEINSDSAEHAKETAIKQYHSNQLVLSPGELINKKIQVSDINDTVIDWKEF